MFCGIKIYMINIINILIYVRKFTTTFKISKLSSVTYTFCVFQLVVLVIIECGVFYTSCTICMVVEIRFQNNH